MRTLTKDSNIYEIRDRIVKVYLKKILRRFRQLNQSLLAFDEINSMNAVYTAYDEVVDMSVEALKEIAKQTYRWIDDSPYKDKIETYASNESNIYAETLTEKAYHNNPQFIKFKDEKGVSFRAIDNFDKSAICDEDFLVDMWLSDWLKQADPVMHYKFYEEADRKRSRLFEAIESVRTSAERKKQIDIGMRYWVKQFEQTADNLVDAVVLQAYKDNNVQYVKWMIMNDAKVCNDCYRRNGKIYPIDSPLLRALHWNCRCWWIPIRKNVFKK